ncbi:hypothetical protein MMC28_000832 [Mycoblastus sanguinarius]|nr:hypothetical protein [Mycoblastus sanguinarius]
MRPIVEERQRGLQPTPESVQQLCHAERQMAAYERLMITDDIEPSFRRPLYRMIEEYKAFKHNPFDSDRPRFEDLLLHDVTIKEHVIKVRERLEDDVARLRHFVCDIIFDEYCMMRATSLEEKEPAWIQFGTYLHWKDRTGEDKKAAMEELANELNLVGPNRSKLREYVGWRLDQMIHKSGLSKGYVKDLILEYAFTDNRHIGKWQRYARDHQWRDLAAKLHKDWIQATACQFDTHLLRSRRMQQILSNIQNTTKMYFKRLRGSDDFELNSWAKNADKRRRKSETKTEKVKDSSKSMSPSCSINSSASSFSVSSDGELIRHWNQYGKMPFHGVEMRA